MKKSVYIVLALVLGVFPAFAQENIAVHPLDNTAETPMAAVFYEELLKAMPRVPGYTGAYRPYIIDLENNRPADVPPGGFPSYICPPLSLTAGAPYVITGEVGEDAEYPGDYWVRLYLWQTDESQLLVSDMVSASDRESAAENYPYLLLSLYQKIDEYEQLMFPTQPQPQPQNLPEIKYTPEPDTRYTMSTNYSLYFGLRGGAGNASWKVDQVQNTATGFLDLNVAFQAIIELSYPLAIQLEANLHGHFAIYDYSEGNVFGGENNPIIWNMTVPLFFKYNVFSGKYHLSVYGGPWMFFPMKIPQIWYEDKDVDHSLWPSWKSSVGLSFGLTVGWRVGFNDGTIFFDARYNHLLDFDKSHELYTFNGTVLSIGYQWGLIRKRR